MCAIRTVDVQTLIPELAFVVLFSVSCWTSGFSHGEMVLHLEPINESVILVHVSRIPPGQTWL